MNKIFGGKNKIWDKLLSEMRVEVGAGFRNFVGTLGSHSSGCVSSRLQTK
jgi:hypothetical protein